jgi:3-ketosteroid 9alpha-monooxygenase subunit B
VAVGEFYRLRVAEVVPETPDAVSVVFTVPAELAHRYAYRPGQFLTLRIPGPDGSSLARCYSLSSSPEQGDQLRVTVKRVADGHGSNWICDNLAPGAELDTLPPAGTFTPRSLDDDLLLVAAGSGITPVMSILRAALIRGRGRLTLLYANRDERSVIFAEELRALVAEHPDRLVVVHWLESVQGLPGQAPLVELARPFADREVFLCGPTAFMEQVSHALRELGVPRKRLHIERFISLTEDPFRTGVLPPSSPGAQPSSSADEPSATSPDEAPAISREGVVQAVLVTGSTVHAKDGVEGDAPADDGRTGAGGGSESPAAGAGGESSVEVELDGERHTLRWPAGVKLLDLLRDNGLDAPFSCREGACSACACRLTGGEVKMLRNEVLDQTDLDEGYILACQALPVTESVSVTYDE